MYRLTREVVGDYVSWFGRENSVKEENRRWCTVEDQGNEGSPKTIEEEVNG